MSQIETPENILCTKSHEYVVVDGKTATIGITAYAAEQLGDIVYVEMPEVDTEFKKGDSFGTVESVKAASEIYIPLAGKITEINDELEAAPELINEAPYDKGWIIKISDFNQDDLKECMSMQDYLKFVEE